MYQIEAKSPPTKEQKERAQRDRNNPRPHRDGDWNHGSGREDTWREPGRERPMPGPSGLS